MNLYIIDIKLIDQEAQYLLDHLTKYNGQMCDIVEIINP